MNSLNHFSNFELIEKGPQHVNPTFLCRFASLPPPHPQRDISLSHCQPTPPLYIFVALPTGQGNISLWFLCDLEEKVHPSQRNVALSLWDKLQGGLKETFLCRPDKATKNSSLRHYFVALTLWQRNVSLNPPPWSLSPCQRDKETFLF